MPALCLLAGPAALAGSTGTTSKSRVYRWVDAHGELHFGDHPPADDVHGEGKAGGGTAEQRKPTPAAQPGPAATGAPDPKGPTPDPQGPKDAKASEDPAKQ